MWLLLLLSRFSRVRLCVTPQMAAHQAPCPWDSLAKNTGVGCHFLLQCMKVKSESEVAQPCLTLCDPRDGSPPGSPNPGILQARTLKWVAVSFSNAWKWKVKVKLLSRVQLVETPWTAAYQAPPSMGFSKQEYWSGVPLPSPQKNLNTKYSSKVSECHVLNCHVRGQTEEARRNPISQPPKQKLHYRKLIRMKKQKVMCQKRQDKTPGKQWNEVEIGNLLEK